MCAEVVTDVLKRPCGDEEDHVHKDLLLFPIMPQKSLCSVPPSSSSTAKCVILFPRHSCIDIILHFRLDFNNKHATFSM